MPRVAAPAPRTVLRDILLEAIGAGRGPSHFIAFAVFAGGAPFTFTLLFISGSFRLKFQAAEPQAFNALRTGKGRVCKTSQRRVVASPPSFPRSRCRDRRRLVNRGTRLSRTAVNRRRSYRAAVNRRGKAKVAARKDGH